MKVQKVVRAIAYFFPPLIWMGVIFYFSSRSKISVSPTYIVNFIVFKSLHIIEYAILYFLWFRAINSLNNKKSFFKFLMAATLSILFAISDEFHQTFIATRTGLARDVFIDSLGIIIMYIYIKNHLRFLKKML